MKERLTVKQNLIMSCPNILDATLSSFFGAHAHP
jgi:hypothetical protein